MFACSRSLLYSIFWSTVRETRHARERKEKCRGQWRGERTEGERKHGCPRMRLKPKEKREEISSRFLTISNAGSITFYSTPFSLSLYWHGHHSNPDDWQEDSSVGSRVLVRRRTVLSSTRPCCSTPFQCCCRN